MKKLLIIFCFIPFILNGQIRSGVVASTPSINPYLALTWDDTTNCPVVTVLNVAHWNTLFNLPTKGSVFTSVTVTGGLVKLFGGGNMQINNGLQANTHLLSIVDNGNIVTSLISQAFNGSTGLTTVNLPYVTTIAGYAFASCTGLTSISLPLLTTATDRSFYNCSSLATLNLPSLTTVNDIRCFAFCNSLTSLSLPVLATMGTSTGDNDVFMNITLKTITLTIPAALMTCNGGNPDGDIVELTTNNTVTIIQL